MPYVDKSHRPLVWLAIAGCLVLAVGAVVAQFTDSKSTEATNAEAFADLDRILSPVCGRTTADATSITVFLPDGDAECLEGVEGMLRGAGFSQADLVRAESGPVDSDDGTTLSVARAAGGRLVALEA